MEAPRFFSPGEGGNLRCGLCPRACLLPPGGSGSCRVRLNRGGEPDLPYRGQVTALALDPIEKKPLYHFRPGTEILSVGFAGCNLRCPFCQNWHISQDVQSVDKRSMSPNELVEAAARTSPAQIAYTYSEPLVHIEYLLDSMTGARKAGAANVLVSNGCINADAAEEILRLVDGANIDLKCFSEETYREVLGGDLSTVLDFIRRAVERGVALELTTLVVPGLNDSEAELDKCRDFIAELESSGAFVPWHLSAYRPQYKWKAPATEPDFLIQAARRGREKVQFVYTGNISGAEGFNDTPCPHCGKTLIGRRGYRVDASGLKLGEESGKRVYLCGACGKRAPVVW